MNTSIQIRTVENGYTLSHAIEKELAESDERRAFMKSDWDEKEYVFAKWNEVLDFLKNNEPSVKATK